MCYKYRYLNHTLMYFCFQSLKSELEKVKSKEKEVMERMEEDAKDLEKMASKQNLLHQKIDECTKKIRDLGSLPSDAFDKYQVSKCNIKLN